MKPNTQRTPFKLSMPVKDIDGTELYELQLREPITGDLCDMDENENTNRQMLQLISNCAGIEVAQIKRLPLSDTVPIFGWLNDFLSGGVAPSGETPSD